MKRRAVAGAVIVGGVALGTYFYFNAPNREPVREISHVSRNDRPQQAEPPNKTASIAAAPIATKAFSMFGGAIDLEGKSVLAIIEAHSAAARRGDATAAYRVYKVEALCSQAPLLRKILVDEAPASDKSERLAEADATAKACEGVTPAQMQERFVFLDIAVKAGNPQAVLDYRQEGPNGQWADVEQQPNDPNVAQWRRNAIEYLTALANTGSVDAWQVLSIDYQSGLIVAKDPQKALKYDLAAIIATHPETDPLKVNYIAKQAKALPPETVSATLEEARRLAKTSTYRRAT